jgi:hypothetical protein
METTVTKHRNLFHPPIKGGNATLPPVIQSPPLKELLKTVEWLDFLDPDISKIYTYARSATKEKKIGKKHLTREPSILHYTGCGTNTLELPDWLPPAVKEKVSSIYTNMSDQAEATDQIDLLFRLARDPRMKNVWNELYKKTRLPEENTERFVHRPFFWGIGCAKALRLKAAEFRVPPDESVENIERLDEDIGTLLINIPKEPTDLQERQDLAVQYFFHHAYLTALVDSPVLTFVEMERLYKERELSARRLRTEADKLRSFGMKVEAKELTRIALECEKNTSYLYNVWILYRQRTDNRLRGYVLTLAELNKQLFTTPLYGTLATITNVAFNRTKITGQQVREMLRGGQRLPAVRGV